MSHTYPMIHERTYRIDVLQAETVEQEEALAALLHEGVIVEIVERVIVDGVTMTPADAEYLAANGISLN